MNPNDIKKIIARTYQSDSVERRMLEEIITALGEYQNNFLHNLENRIIDEAAASDWDDKFNVAVRLIKRDDTEAKRGLFPINVGNNLVFEDENSESPFEESAAPAHKIFQMAFFLDVDYSELSKFCESKVYSGVMINTDDTVKNFTYSLRRHDKFIRREQILFDLAAAYKIRRPVIFSPYARKAVEIKLNGLSKADFDQFKNFDLQLAKNNLRGKLLTSSELYWNVDISDAVSHRGGSIDEYVGADGGLIRYEYVHTFNLGENVFVLPDRPCDDFRITNSEAAQEIRLGYTSDQINNSVRIVRFGDFDADGAGTFANDFPKKNNKLRARSVGDVEKILSSFNATRAGKNFPASFGNQNPAADKIIAAYDKDASYYAPPADKLLGQIRSRPTCYINFAGGDSKIKTDYANYVLNYFAQNYPEYRWAGVSE